MSKRKPGLTRAQHQAIGAEARRMHSSLLTIGTTAANAYGKSNPRVVKVMRAAQRAVNALGTMRSELEALLAAQHADWKTTDYYGGTPKGDFEAQLAALAPKTSWTLSELLAAKFPAPQEPPRGKRKQGIVQLLSERGALTRDDLHAAVGGSTTALDAVLMDLKLDGYIEISDGRYRIREYPDHDNA